METELWPNSINACARRGIPVVLANARLSARSARGYWRARALTAPMLRQLTRVVAQNSIDGARFVELGLPRERLRVSGSIKFDITLEPSVLAAAASAKSQWQAAGRLIWIAASTHAGEDEIILSTQRQLRIAGIDSLLILVPRHPERFDVVASLIERAGFSLQRRSKNAAPSATVEVLLGDTMGELLWLYGCADIAFVGGSLVPRGGHNTLEPAAWGLPILSGPSDFNFRAIATLLQESGALVEVGDADALARALVLLASDPVERARRGDAARAVIEKNRGAIEQLLAEIAQLLPARS